MPHTQAVQDNAGMEMFRGGAGRIHPSSPLHSRFLCLMGTQEPPSQPCLSGQAVAQSLTGCCEQAVLLQRVWGARLVAPLHPVCCANTGLLCFQASKQVRSHMQGGQAGCGHSCAACKDVEGKVGGRRGSPDPHPPSRGYLLKAAPRSTPENNLYPR